LGYTALLSFGLEVVTPLYHSLFLILLAAASALLTTRLTRDTEGRSALTILLIFTLPIAVHLAGTPLVDLPLAFFVTAALCEAVRTDERKGRFVRAGLFVGLGAATKYNGALAAALLVFLTAGILPASKKERAQRALILAVSALIPFLPWAFKNFFWTGNPFFPLARSFLGGPRSSFPAGSLSYGPLFQRVALYGESAFDLVLLPFRIFLFGADGDPTRYDGVLSVLFLLSLVPVWRLTHQPNRRLIFLFSWFLLVLSLLTAPARVRYLAPLFGAFASLTSLLPPRLLKLALPIQLVLSCWYLGSHLSSANVFSYLLQGESRQKYLAARIPEYPVIEWANKFLPPTSKTYLLLTSNSFYLYNVPVFTTGHLSQRPLLFWLRTGTDATEIRELVKKEGITHFIAQYRRLDQVLTTLSADERMKWNQFSRASLTPLWKYEDYIVWEVK
jgi:4-amino-4-deoxy-L-arabinose transferase-like glycosyltransferase